MPPLALDIRSMGIDVPVLLWIGAALLVLGLFFALAGRRPAHRRRPPRKPGDASRARTDSTFTDDV
ncbi:hypothetical protein [Cumulibacter manganitolerans]|uniref:hypothetical protein n=1 Tax=Cumulibacter manganitolerans TaxID=1884992 RepID=UPI001297BA18|nr:hypothetical protein [Cumulibacter manganitolerans]